MGKPEPSKLGKPVRSIIILDFVEARVEMDWQWHQLDRFRFRLISIVARGLKITRTSF